MLCYIYRPLLDFQVTWRHRGRIMLELSAINPWCGINPGWFEFYSGKFEAAVDGYRKEYEMDPQSPFGRWAYGSVACVGSSYQ